MILKLESFRKDERSDSQKYNDAYARQYETQHGKEYFDFEVMLEAFEKSFNMMESEDYFPINYDERLPDTYSINTAE